MSKVVLIRCESYADKTVQKSIERGLALLGGAEQFVRNGETILLKPNILAGEPPEKCVTTHPAVFKAVAKVLIQAGAQLSYGDSPAIGNPEKAARKSGLAQAAEELGVPFGAFQTGREVDFDKGLQRRKFFIAGAVLDNEGVISLPKLKTHGLEKFTGAIKNQFGCIPGVRKGEFHLKLPGADEFARMLVDLNLLIRPRLYIMDGIWAMEGNGPRGGRPRPMNLILLSSDPVALDATVCRLIQVNPEYVPTTKYGARAGMGTFDEQEIELLGDGFESFIASDFQVDRNPVKSYRTNYFLGFMNNRLVSKPWIETEQCVCCGICVRMCPASPKALSFQNDNAASPPVYDYDKCIRCFCCQEICPEHAIHLKVPLLRKVLDIF